MLRNMRQFAKSGFAIILFALIIISFAIFGINDVMSWGARGDDVAAVGKARVSKAEYAQNFSRALDTLREQTGRVITTQEAADNGFDNQLLQQMVDEALVLEMANQANITVADTLVAKEIRGIQAFHDPIKGAFDQVTYERRLRENGMVPAFFEARLRDDLARRQLMNTIAVGIAAPQSYVTRRHNYLHETRDADVVMIDPGVVGMPPQATDEELTTYLNDNPGPFKKPEVRTISYVHFSQETAREQVKIEEDKVKELYDFRKDQLGTPEKRAYTQIIVPDAAIGGAVVEALQAGTNIDAVIEANDLSNAIATAPEAKASIADKMIAEAVFGAKTGDVIGPVEGKLSTSVLVVGDIIPAKTVAYEDVKAELKAGLVNEAASEIVLDHTQKFQDEHDAGGTLEESAKAADMTLGTLDNLLRSGLVQDGEAPAFIIQNPDLLDTIFGLDTGIDSEIIPLSSGGYVAVRVDAITPESLPALADIKDRVAQFWKAEKMREMLNAKVQEIMVATEKGETLKDLAKSEGLRLERIEALSRAETMGGQTPPILQQILAAREGETVSGMIAPMAMGVAQVTKLTPAPANDDQAADKEARQQLNIAITNDIASQYLNTARTRVQINIYPDRAKSAIGLDTATADPNS